MHRQVWERQVPGHAVLLATAVLPLSSLRPLLSLPTHLAAASTSSHSFWLPLMLHQPPICQPLGSALNVTIVHSRHSQDSLPTSRQHVPLLKYPEASPAASLPGGPAAGHSPDTGAADEADIGTQTSGVWNASSSLQQPAEQAGSQPVSSVPLSASPTQPTSTKPSKGHPGPSHAESSELKRLRPDSLSAILARWGLQDEEAANENSTDDDDDPAVILAQLQQSYDHTAIEEALSSSSLLGPLTQPSPANRPASAVAYQSVLSLNNDLQLSQQPPSSQAAVQQLDADADRDQLDAILHRWGVSSSLNRPVPTPSTPHEMSTGTVVTAAQQQEQEPGWADSELDAELADIFALLKRPGPAATSTEPGSRSFPPWYSHTGKADSSRLPASPVTDVADRDLKAQTAPNNAAASADADSASCAQEAATSRLQQGQQHSPSSGEPGSAQQHMHATSDSSPQSGHVTEATQNPASATRHVSCADRPQRHTARSQQPAESNAEHEQQSQVEVIEQDEQCDRQLRLQVSIGRALHVPWELLESR